MFRFKWSSEISESDQELESDSDKKTSPVCEESDKSLLKKKKNNGWPLSEWLKRSFF